jgi:hypothetical protein
LNPLLEHSASAALSKIVIPNVGGLWGVPSRICLDSNKDVIDFAFRKCISTTRLVNFKTIRYLTAVAPVTAGTSSILAGRVRRVHHLQVVTIVGLLGELRQSGKMQFLGGRMIQNAVSLWQNVEGHPFLPLLTL